MSTETRWPWQRIGIFGALWTMVTMAAVLSPACYGRNCDGSVATFDGAGVMLDDGTWASSALEGEWLPFPGQRTWVFDIPALGGRTPELRKAQISPSAKPMTSGTGFADSAGNLAKVLNVRPSGLTVYNDSCSMFYLRLVLDVPPYPPESRAPDSRPNSGTAEVVDAGSDAAIADVDDAQDGGDGG